MPRAIEQFEQHATKVPEVTIVFWIIKIAATTLGETGGDTVTMTLDWGYLVGTAIFFSLLIVLVIWQILAKKSFIRICTGRPLLPRRLPARPWLISQIARSALDTPGDRCFCSRAS